MTGSLEKASNPGIREILIILERLKRKVVLSSGSLFNVTTTHFEDNKCDERQ